MQQIDSTDGQVGRPQQNEAVVGNFIPGVPGEHKDREGDHDAENFDQNVKQQKAEDLNGVEKRQDQACNEESGGGCLLRTYALEKVGERYGSGKGGRKQNKYHLYLEGCERIGVPIFLDYGIKRGLVNLLTETAITVGLADAS